MYIIGNSKTSEHVTMWSDVLGILKKGGLFGDSLSLCCPRHPDTAINVQQPEDFLRSSPEAGCDLPCDKQLSCGHACVNKCHSDILHNAVYCQKTCTRPKAGCTHNCPRPCGAKCDLRCEIEVNHTDLELACGHHMTSLPCWQFQDPSKVLCDVRMERTVPGCNHEITELCCADVNADNYSCPAVCGAILPCGHTCKRACNKCQIKMDGEVVRSDHGKCKQACERNYTTCHHRCRSACHGKEPCPLCEARCDVRCSHAVCDKKCHEPCAPCAEERCTSHCSHSSCNMPCAAPCDWVPCSRRCEKVLPCGHQCKSLFA